MSGSEGNTVTYCPGERSGLQTQQCGRRLHTGSNWNWKGPVWPPRERVQVRRVLGQNPVRHQNARHRQRMKPGETSRKGEMARHIISRRKWQSTAQNAAHVQSQEWTGKCRLVLASKLPLEDLLKVVSIKWKRGQARLQWLGN